LKRSHAGAVLSIAVHAVVASIAAMGATVSSSPALPTAPPAPPVAPTIEIELLDQPAAVVVTHAAPSRSSTTIAKRPPAVAVAVAMPPPTTTAASDVPVAATQSTAVAIATASVTTAPREAAAPHGVAMLPSMRAAADRMNERSPIAASPSRPGAASAADQPLAMTRTATTFTMNIDPDGTAHLHDRSNLQLAFGRHASRAAESPGPSLEDLHEQSNAVDVAVAPIGATVLTFDLTDWAMRVAGDDPYAFEKLKVLDATREQRAQIGARHREQLLLHTPELVRASLEQVAALPSDERRTALLQLWRDCDATPSGALARTTIATYVRTHPQFSDADLALLERPN
jgi:hypothetical protein